MKIASNLRQTEHGYYEIHPKPSLQELKEHYEKKYYQEGCGSYQAHYEEHELHYLTSEAKLAEITVERYANCQRSLLDIGCGEGYFSQVFLSQGWEVTCCDFSESGINQHNPSLAPHFIQGDIFNILETMSSEGKDFGLLNLDNVLEHVIDPVGLLHQMRELMSAESVARIEVPNDFSAFQELLVDKGLTNVTWIHPLEHLSYFNSASLKRLLESAGFELLSLQADFPIEQFLVNPNSNYYKDRSLGRSAHETRMLCTSYLVERGAEHYIDYCEAAAKLDYGRQLIAYVKVA